MTNLGTHLMTIGNIALVALNERTRRAALDHAATSGEGVMFYHLPFPGVQPLNVH